MVDHGFRFPFALTALGQVSSVSMGAWEARRAAMHGRRQAGCSGTRLQLVLLCSVSAELPAPACLPACAPAPAALLACQLGLFSLRPPPSLRFALTRLLPVSASFAACLFLGNVAYLGLSGAAARCQGGARCARPTGCLHLRRLPSSPRGPPPPRPAAPPPRAVAFINMLKAATPLVTLAVGLALGMEQLSLPVLLSTGLIFGGTTVATASEAATGAQAAGLGAAGGKTQGAAEAVRARHTLMFAPPILPSHHPPCRPLQLALFHRLCLLHCI